MQARWRSDGKELFFVAPDGKLMSAEVGAKSGDFESGQASALFAPLVINRGHLYDAAAGGQRFLAEVPPEQEISALLTLVQNWTAGLKK